MDKPCKPNIDIDLISTTNSLPLIEEGDEQIYENITTQEKLSFKKRCIFVIKITFALLWTWYVNFCPILPMGYSLRKQEQDLYRPLIQSKVELVQIQTNHSTVRRLNRWELKFKPILKLLLALKNNLTYLGGVMKHLYFYSQSLAYRKNENDVLSFSKMCNSLGLAAIRRPYPIMRDNLDIPVIVGLEESRTFYESFLLLNLESNLRLFYQNNSFSLFAAGYLEVTDAELELQVNLPSFWNNLGPGDESVIQLDSGVYGLIKTFDGISFLEAFRATQLPLDTTGLASGIDWIISTNSPFLPILVQPAGLRVRGEANSPLLPERVNPNPGFITRTLRPIRRTISRGLSFIWNYRFEITFVGLLGTLRWGLHHRTEANNLRRIRFVEALEREQAAVNAMYMGHMEGNVRNLFREPNFHILLPRSRRHR